MSTSDTDVKTQLTGPKKRELVLLMSLVKLLISLPIGVTSKNRLTGALVTLDSRSWCIVVAIVVPM